MILTELYDDQASAARLNRTEEELLQSIVRSEGKCATLRVVTISDRITEGITEDVQCDVDRLIFRLTNEDPLYIWFLVLRIEKAHLMRVWTLREQGYVELDGLSDLRRRRARFVCDYLETVSKYKRNVLTALRRLKSRALDSVYLKFGTIPADQQEHSTSCNGGFAITANMV